MPDIAELERRYHEAHRAWQANGPTRELEHEVDRAADALRRARQATYEAEGITNWDKRDTMYKDDDDGRREDH